VIRQRRHEAKPSPDSEERPVRERNVATLVQTGGQKTGARIYAASGQVEGARPVANRPIIALPGKNCRKSLGVGRPGNR
jgi:hypothetical protein